MANLIIKPQNVSGDKVIIQDQAGGAVLTTADSGAELTSTTPILPPTATGSAPSAAAGKLYYDSTKKALMYSDGISWIRVLGTTTSANYSRPGDGFYDVDAHTKLLIRSVNQANGSSTFTDLSSTGHGLSAWGDPTHSTAQGKMSSSSIHLDGNDGLNVAASSEFNVGAGQFTWDFWFYPITALNRMWFFGGTQDHNLSLAYKHQSSNLLEGWASTNGSSWNVIGDGASGTGQGNTSSLELNKWQHIAFVRYENTYMIFHNGRMDMDHGSSGTLTSELGNGWKLGRHANDAYGCVGYFQEWRFSTIARWTSDFTVY